ncbi:uncharacterized protein (DUF2235 family) [Palleronia aestuarii]|uniref:Uncharacterized protein (DUF2235 family) n=1 Tax=Palleronia aestuarii TaxID=568105 RepID=A0A2W7NK58_9RHOB|nr:DUF2235 domain-containing protein [Palleronia aestuarii]PZX11692.1 uncharacterized protein (DUF2235 family) [Palleronia aestuarii]
MKRIAILCDGTWNRFDSRTPTNVVRLAQLLSPTDPEGVTQVPVYLNGVGAGVGATGASRLADRVLGGALGWGLLENVVEAYRQLVFLYEPGDEIFIFGFSRGAYTARSLTGFIRSTGIIGRDDLTLIPRAVRRYRSKGGENLAPGSDESHEFRAQTMRSCVATSRGELDWRRRNDAPDVPLLRVAYLGVWDSVGALGVPRDVPLLGNWTARKYEFHDARLSGMVKSARHAVALDETRRAFEPTCWTNIADLNTAAGASGTCPYQELYFAGDHGSIGGGGNITALSSIALGWIVEGAQAAGLAFDASRLEALVREGDPFGPLRCSSIPPSGIADWITRIRPRPRTGPTSCDAVHSSVLERFYGRPGIEAAELYRPRSLRAIEEKLASLYANAGSVTLNEGQGI